MLSCSSGRAAIILAATAVMTLPLWLARLPLLADLPQHAARLDILLRLSDSASLREYYAVQPGLVPYFGWEAVALPLAWLFGPYVGASLGVVVSLMLLSGGTLALGWVVQHRIRWEMASVVLPLYGATLGWGNLTYLVGAALVLYVLAGWIACSGWPSWRRAVAFIPLCSLLYLAHLLALGAFALFAAAFELGRLRGSGGRALVKALAWTAVPTLLPLSLWLQMAPGPHPSGVDFGTLEHHVIALASPFAFSLSVEQDFSPGAGVDMATMLAVALGLYAGWRSGRLRLAEPLRWPLGIGLAVALAMPPLLHGVWVMHVRLPLLLAFMLVAAMRVDWPSRRHVGAATVVLVLLAIARLGTAGAEMGACAPLVAEFRTAFRSLPRGARLLTVLEDGPASWRNACPGAIRFGHVAMLAVIERDAFVPTVFHRTTILALQPRYVVDGDGEIPSSAILRQTNEAGAAPGMWSDWRHRFTHVLWLHFGEDPDPPPLELHRVHAGTAFDLYAVAP